MKYSNICNVQKMLLDESYLSSQFKFGFELEGIIDIDSIFKHFPNIRQKYEDMFNKLKHDVINYQRKTNNTDDITWCNTILENYDLAKEYVFEHLADFYKNIGSEKIIYKNRDITNVITAMKFNYNIGLETQKYFNDIRFEVKDYFDKAFGEMGRLSIDGSIKTRYGLPFEWSSPVLDFTPQVLKKMIDVLSDIQIKYGISVNDSCGFHTHISFPDITKEDAVWIVCNLANDEKMYHKMCVVGGIYFCGYVYSTTEEMDKINLHLKRNETPDYEMIAEHLPVGIKQSNINIHSLGTIEWRGPRGFLPNEKQRNNPLNPDENKKNMLPYIKMLWSFIKWIQKIMDSEQIIISGETYSKDEFVSNILYYYTHEKGDINFKEKPSRSEYEKSLKRDAIKFIKTLNPQIAYDIIDDEFDDFSNYVTYFCDKIKDNSTKLVKDDFSEFANKLDELKHRESKSEHPDYRLLCMINDILNEYYEKKYFDSK